MGANKTPREEWQLPDGRRALPRAALWPALFKLHQETHGGAEAMAAIVNRLWHAPGVFHEAKRVLSSCDICAKFNPRGEPKSPPGARLWAYMPFEWLQIDYSEMSKCQGYKYLLVTVCQLTGWTEAFLTRRATALEVRKTLLNHVIPRFDPPRSIDSDQGTHFTSPGLYFICGHDAYKALLLGWHGRCGVARVLPDVQVNTTLDSHQILNLGTYSHKLFTPLKGVRVKRAENPLVIRQTGFHSFIRGLIPGLGVAKLERAVVNISAELEKAANASLDAFQKLQREIDDIAEVTLQNRPVLDVMNAEVGGACAHIGEQCCFYINRSGLIEEDLQTIKDAAVVFHTVSLDHTLNFEDLLLDLGSWFTGLFCKIVKCIILFLFFLRVVWVMLQCAKCLCSAVTKGSTVCRRTQYLSLHLVNYCPKHF
uniref:Integrase catalytic domain-containing protein n=1 Tax=Gopherus agassizii TaxID=38772 RepID=A0A452IKI2_9SAUR